MSSLIDLPIIAASRHGKEMSKLVCDQDLGGWSRSGSAASIWRNLTRWVKIWNPRYSQIVGREKLFEKLTAS
jgi:hypothetical protein